MEFYYSMAKNKMSFNKSKKEKNAKVISAFSFVD